MLRVSEEFHGSHTGRQRPANEDSLYARSPLFAVADGMGGAQAGEIASRLGVETPGREEGAAGKPEERPGRRGSAADRRRPGPTRSRHSPARQGPAHTAPLSGVE